MAEEVWSGVIFFPGYWVSSHGRVKRGEKFIRGGRNRSGYRLLSMRDLLGRTRWVYIHRLVLLHFSGPGPLGALCLHGDGNPENNNIENLRWGTHRDNSLDSMRHGTWRRPPTICGESNKTSKLTEDKVREIRRLFDTGEMNAYQISKKFGVANSNIWFIVQRKTWRHVA